MKEMLSDLLKSRLIVQIFLIAIIAGLWTVARKLDAIK
jgi:hypothetical protein